MVQWVDVQMDGWIEIDEQIDGWVGWMDGAKSQLYSILLLLQQTSYKAFPVVQSRSWEKALIDCITMLQ